MDLSKIFKNKGKMLLPGRADQKEKHINFGEDRKKREFSLKIKNKRRELLSKIQAVIKFLPAKFYVALLFITLGIVAIILIINSNWLLITEVKFAQLKHVDLQKVQKIGVTAKGEKYFLYNTSKLAEEIKNADPFVKTVAINKIFPYMLSIKINERVPAFYLIKEPLILLADSEGYVLDKYEVKAQQPKTEQNTQAQPNDENIEKQKFLIKYAALQVSVEKMQISLNQKPGQKIEVPGLKFVTALHSWASQLEFKGQPFVKSYGIYDQFVELNMTSGSVIRFDYEQDFVVQKKRFEAIWQEVQISGQKLKFLDVSLERPYGIFE